LLLDDSVKNSVEHSGSKDRRFAELKTINAQSLIPIFNKLSEKKLSSLFKFKYEGTRKLRNTIMHSLDKNLELIAAEVIITILEANEELLQPKQWIEFRRDFLKCQPIKSVQSYSWSYEMQDSPEYEIYRELNLLIDILKPSQLRKYFGFNKKQRRYTCINCLYQMGSIARDFDLNIDLAQLIPNSPEATEVYCIICESKRKIIRANCINKDCKSNVIDSENNTCLTCGEHQQNSY
jgi:hypothetical protein